MIMSKPAHKQNDSSQAPGQVVNPLPSELTLADYKLQDAFDAVAKEKKLTFEQWWNKCYECDNLYKDIKQYKKHFMNCWTFAQENK